LILAVEVDYPEEAQNLVEVEDYRGEADCPEEVEVV
jgi:hypothetical protein